ncbi:chemotaxis response regulator protein-glutamate methylesterase [Azoarcus indigens]|uniref:protein-glutamate methylesterase n=1 Tax=Azoarcus indigens TaxID=29545 RepID=A0A4R6EFT7_9RHOO|nr:chemotaxis protein CheB [Azoarcus indigens]NMG63654.1 chemotaxis response regulator protein-glutamate methylesterase [Azoarcus indigens]TDN56188.1 two-component system chemotaxis response regulator CheB [Azoarcus indigens]
MEGRPTRIFICEGSAITRTQLADLIGKQAGLRLVGSAAELITATEAQRRQVDVLLVGEGLPGKAQTRAAAVRGIAVLTLGETGAFHVPRPGARSPAELSEYGRLLAERLREASRNVGAVGGGPTAGPSLPRRLGAYPGRIVFIGASTGGTEAIKDVLLGLPAQMPPVLMVQHMPEMFTPSFAKRLDDLCALHVKEAAHGERLQPGTVYLAPGHSHLSIARSGGGYQCELARSEPVNRHRPSVDVLFRSAAAEVGAAAIGVLLTGMGKDGAEGLLRMKHAGAWTIAQDQQSCVVYGMPREAVALGAAREVLPLNAIAHHLMQRLASPLHTD